MGRFEDLLNGIHSTTIVDAAVLVREVRLCVGVLSTPVTVRIWYEARQEESYRFELSALMKTARERDPREAPRRAPTEAEALRRAVRMLTQDYEDAIRQGHMPDDSWLVDGDRL